MDEEVPSSSGADVTTVAAEHMLMSALLGSTTNAVPMTTPQRSVDKDKDGDDDWVEHPAGAEQSPLLVSSTSSPPSPPEISFMEEDDDPRTTAQHESLVDALWRRHQQQQSHGFLPKDIYSLLVTAKPGSHGFTLACCTVAVQMIVLLLLSFDSIDFAGGDDEYPTNWLQVPATSELQVTVAQFLALSIASLTQYDVVQAMLLYYGGYPQERFVAALGEEDSFTPQWLRVRWYGALATRFGIGFAATTVTFMLVARSGTVRDVMVRMYLRDRRRGGMAIRTGAMYSPLSSLSVGLYRD